MKILIYDVETAQKKNIGSICAVGWISLDNDQVIDSGYSLIDPKCSFSKINTSIHGITSKDIAGAPCFEEYWNSTMKALMGDHLVIAHSASFDIAATEQALYNCKLEDPGIDYLDSLQVFRQFFSDSCKLVDLAAKYGYEYNAHNALEDCKALLYVLHALAENLKYEDLAALLLRANVLVQNTHRNHFKPQAASFVPPAFQNKQHFTAVAEQVDDLLSGLRLCLTGDVPGYERKDIEKMIIEHGGQVTSSVSGKTNILIVGDYPDYPEGFISSKQAKARALNAEGKNIRIISPDELFSMFKGNDSNG